MDGDHTRTLRFLSPLPCVCVSVCVCVVDVVVDAIAVVTAYEVDCYAAVVLGFVVSYTTVIDHQNTHSKGEPCCLELSVIWCY